MSRELVRINSVTLQGLRDLGTVVNGQDMDNFYQWAGSSDDEDFFCFRRWIKCGH